jgi:lipopolysaccharide export system permease protein
VIIGRYIVRTIHLGTLVALLGLVSLGLFFEFMGELGDLGKGDYDLPQILKFIALSFPGQVVEFMPLAVLLGSIISLGALAGNSEIIAMQASGVSLTRLISPVLVAALILAVFNFLLADLVVPDTETFARDTKNLALERTSGLSGSGQQGFWIKDESRVLHIGQLLPNGNALDIDIFRLDQDGRMSSVISAESAIPRGQGWELQQVDETRFVDGETVTASYEQLAYDGNLSHQLLNVLMIEPRQMSSKKLYAYLEFLDQNKLDASAERLVFWQKLFAPLTIVIMSLLAVPFVLGAQRQSNTGMRLLIGILIGLSFIVLNRLLTQLGVQFQINAMVTALLPNLALVSTAVYLLVRKQASGPGG